MSDPALALFDVPAVPERVCWYCGAKSGPFEREHQVPRSRGGGDAGNVVLSCPRCFRAVFTDLRSEVAVSGVTHT